MKEAVVVATPALLKSAAIDLIQVSSKEGTKQAFKQLGKDLKDNFKGAVAYEVFDLFAKKVLKPK